MILRNVSILAALSACALAHGSLDSLLEPLPIPQEPAPQEVKAAEPEFAIKAAESQSVATPFLGERQALAELRALLIERYRPEGDLRLGFVRAWTPVELPKADWRLELTEAPQSNLEPKMSLRFTIVSDNRILEELRASLICELWVDAWIAKRQLNRGKEPEEADFEIKSVNALRLRYPPVPAAADLSDFELSQTVSAGDPLFYRDVKTRPVVRKGSVVEAIASDGMLRISMKAVAMEDGLEGEFIRVRNIESRKDFQAQTLRAGLVQVHF